jgi:hypothetical protein
MAANVLVDQEFKIVTGEKDNTIIVLLLGQIRSQEVPELEGLLNFIVEKPQPSVIISFRDVTQFLPGAHSTWTKVQSGVRKSGKLLTVCSFRPEIKNLLLQAGVIRESEIFNNIPDCWQALKVRLSDVISKSEVESKKAA